MFMCCSRASVRCSSCPQVVTFNIDRPGGQGILRGEEHPPRRPAAELGNEPEAAQNFAQFREGGIGPIAVHQALAIEEQFQLGPPLREPIHDVGRDDLQTRFLTQAYFFMDQPQRRLGAQLGMAVEKRLGCRLLATPPRDHHLFNELCRQRQGAGTGRGADIEAELCISRPEGRESGRIACQVVEVRAHMRAC